MPRRVWRGWNASAIVVVGMPMRPTVKISTVDTWKAFIFPADGASRHL
ncbi:MAG: hypothetical protein ACE5R6_21575 [Candidatus Heimdallarchaeota archaeon]